MSDPKRARELAAMDRPPPELRNAYPAYEEVAVTLQGLAAEVDLLRKLHDIEERMRSRSTTFSRTLDDLRQAWEEIDRLRSENQTLKDYFEPEDYNRLIQREESTWKPLLAAAKDFEAAVDDYAILGDVGVVGRRLRERIVACEEET